MTKTTPRRIGQPGSLGIGEMTGLFSGQVTKFRDGILKGRAVYFSGLLLSAEGTTALARASAKLGAPGLSVTKAWMTAAKGGC